MAIRPIGKKTAADSPALPPTFDIGVSLIQLSDDGQCVEMNTSALRQWRQLSTPSSILHHAFFLYESFGCAPKEDRSAAALIHEALMAIDDPYIRIISGEWLQSDPQNIEDKGPSYYRYEILLSRSQIQRLEGLIEEGQRVIDQPTKPKAAGTKFASGFSSIERNGNKLTIEVHPEDKTKMWIDLGSRRRKGFSPDLQALARKRS